MAIKKKAVLTLAGIKLHPERKLGIGYDCNNALIIGPPCAFLPGPRIMLWFPASRQDEMIKNLAKWYSATVEATMRKASRGLPHA